MPQGHLDESYVRRTAVDWLAKYYQEEPNTQAVVPVIEKYVHKKSRFGKGRADGLIVSQLNDGRIYTASLEAKSARTWKNLKLRYQDILWFSHAAIFAILIVVGTAISGLTASGGWFWGLIVPALIFLGSVSIFLITTHNFANYRTMDVIQQILRYPANEQWIALSTDVFNMMEHKNQQSQFLNRCKKKGIGLIRVSSGKKITLIYAPVPRKLPGSLKDFLECYVAAGEIRKALISTIAQKELVADVISVIEIEEISEDSMFDDLAEEII